MPADDENQPNNPDLPAPAVAARPRPRPRMLRRPANTEEVERDRNTVSSENQAPEVERPLPSVARHPSAHPCIVDHPAAASEEANVAKVRLRNDETTVQDSQPSNKDRLPEIDVSQRATLVETTLDALEGGHVQQDAVGVDNDGNQRVQPPKRNPKRGKQLDS